MTKSEAKQEYWNLQRKINHLVIAESAMAHDPRIVAIQKQQDDLIANYPNINLGPKSK